MALNPKYVTAPSLQSYFVDKDTGLPLAGGKVFFYRDSNRTELKSVYELQGNQANYTYSPLPNPIILSAVGTIQDNNGNDVLPYYFPFDQYGDVDLYYIVVQNSLGVPQFTRQAWPNPDFSNAPASSDDRFNYIPNGQLLAHTDLPDNALVAGTNIIAQGGFTVELDDPALTPASVNTLVFLKEQFTQAPPQSPRYLMQFTCTSFNALETTKNIRIKWTDVNKFSTKPGSYTFAFWGTSNVNLPVAINVVKFYGTAGSPEEIIPQALATITPGMQPTLYQFEINFGLNSGKSVDLVLQDDFIAIDIALPRNIAFVASFTDFVLAAGDVQLLNFPVQTDADMMARGVFGWADKIDPTGMDLYLPPILTKQGMKWDSSQIGIIEMLPASVDSPNSLPAQQHNLMPCDGATYIASEFAANGIPYARLQEYLLFHGPNNASIPLYGTGEDYVSALIPLSGADNDTFRITWNTAGAGSPQASDGTIATGFTFSPMYIYNASTTGTINPNTFCSNTQTDNVLLFALQPGFVALGRPVNGTSAFVINPLDDRNLPDSLFAFQGNNCASSVATVSGATLGTGTTGHYWDFSNNVSNFRMWFNATGSQSAPTTAGRILIQVNIDINYSASDVADVVREAVLGLQSTMITVTGLPPAGSYFEFSSNPAALRNFYVWFQINTDGSITGTDPMVPGRTGIQIVLLSSDSNEIIRDKIRFALNRYQYAAPLFDGVFFRAADPNGIYDFDNALRWSATPNVGGPNPGTFEYSQFLQHDHLQNAATIYSLGAGGSYDGGVSGGLATNATVGSGGSETRPVNTYVYPAIRY